MSRMEISLRTYAKEKLRCGLTVGNVKFVTGYVQTFSPHFLGANPARVVKDPSKSVEILDEVRGQAFRLARELSESQSGKGVSLSAAQGNNVLGPGKVVAPLKPFGIGLGELTDR